MKRIGITQRIEIVPDYGERRDCLDQNWYRLLQRVGALAMPLPNLLENMEEGVGQSQLDGIILTGGNDPVSAPGASGVAPERDLMERRLIDHCLTNNLPILGVCRGLMMINLHLGGEVQPVQDHRAVRHRLEAISDVTLALPEGFEVNSYHNYAIPAAGIANSLLPLAVAEDGTVEAFRHREKPCVGIMWHPERESPFAKLDLDIFNRLFHLEVA